MFGVSMKKKKILKRFVRLGVTSCSWCLWVLEEGEGRDGHTRRQAGQHGRREEKSANS